MNKILKKAVAISAAICSLALPVNALPGSAEDNIKFSDVKENFENITVYGWNNPVLYESMSKVLTHPNFTLNISRYNNKVYYYDPTRNIRFVRYIGYSSDRVIDRKGATPKKTYLNDMICRSDISNNSIERNAYDAIMYNMEKAYDFYSDLGFDYYSFLSDHTIYVSLDEEVGSTNTTSLDGLIRFAMGTGETPNNSSNQGSNQFESTSSLQATQCYGADIDVVAHEFTHLVTQFKLGWDTFNPLETQALMEAYSDIMGELADDTREWKIGTDIYYDNINNNNKNICLRDLAAPENSLTDSSNPEWDKFYSHYEDFKYDYDHNVTVTAYEASTIISHAAYLMYQNGIGIEDLKRIWYYSIDALKDMHGSTQNATFSDCRDAVIAGVKNNYKNSTALYFIQKINDAFDAVGVYSRGDVNDDGQVNGTDAIILNAYCTYRNSKLLPTEHQYKAADVNRDGNPNYDDVECLMSMCRSKYDQADLNIAFNEDKINSFINTVPDRTILGGGAYWNYPARSYINGKANMVCGCNHDNGEYYCTYVPVSAMAYTNYENFDYCREAPYGQCAGFARQMQIDYFDTTKFIQIPLYGSYTPRIGDHLRADYRGILQHSILITGVTDNGNDNYTITYADADANGRCEINISCTATISNGRLYDGLTWSCSWVERPMMVGDVNGDSLINYNDYTEMSNVISGQHVSSLCRLVSDIDFNGRIDANDKALLEEALNEQNPVKASFGFVR